MTDRMTFEQVCSKQPAIMDVYQGIKSHKGAKTWSGWEAYKSQFKHLVGWEASSTDPDLCSPQAYDLVYMALWDQWSYTK